MEKPSGEPQGSLAEPLVPRFPTAEEQAEIDEDRRRRGVPKPPGATQEQRDQLARDLEIARRHGKA